MSRSTMVEVLQQKLRNTEEKLSVTEDELLYYKRQVKQIRDYLSITMGQAYPTAKSDPIAQIEEYIQYRIAQEIGQSTVDNLREIKTQFNQEIEQQCRKLNDQKIRNKRLQLRIKENSQEKVELKRTVKALQLQNSELSLRLSRLAGAHLTRDNPNIADLSDGYRPTKLAEAFTELYDNEWTDAFEELGAVVKDGERERINKLMDLLQMVNTECSAVCKNQRDAINNMKTVTITVDLDKNDGKINEESEVLEIFSMDDSSRQLSAEVTADITISAEHERAVFEIRQRCTEHLEEHKEISKVIASKIAFMERINYLSQQKLVQYITKCAHLCWYMNLAKPPVFIEFEERIVRGNKVAFNTIKYKPYTRSGLNIDYIVWPSLYMYEGGPMLCKGVAQGKN